MENNILSGIITVPSEKVKQDTAKSNQSVKKRKTYHHIVVLTSKQLNMTKSFLDSSKIDYDRNILEDKKNNEWSVFVKQPLTPDYIDKLHKIGVKVTVDEISGKSFEDMLNSATKLPPRQDLKSKLPKSPKSDKMVAPSPSIQSCDLTNKFCCTVTCGKTKKTIKAFSFEEGITKDSAKITLNADEWVFTQATAVSSVNLDKDGHVTEATIRFVNNNANAWETKIIKKYYPTFIGAHNYKDHIQEERQSRGIILDAVPRVVEVTDEDGVTEKVLYVDCLVATNRVKWPEWAQAVDDGKIKFLSVGCSTSTLKCSKCGSLLRTDGDDIPCGCLVYERGMEYYTKDGKKSRVAELVTDEPDANGEQYVEFTELSYLSVNPAFSGAIQSHKIEVEPGSKISLIYPRALLQKSAFQTWKAYIDGVE